MTTQEEQDEALSQVKQARETVLARRQTLETATDDANVFQRRVLISFCRGKNLNA